MRAPESVAAAGLRGARQWRGNGWPTGNAPARKPARRRRLTHRRREEYSFLQAFANSERGFARTGERRARIAETRRNRRALQARCAARAARAWRRAAGNGTAIGADDADGPQRNDAANRTTKYRAKSTEIEDADLGRNRDDCRNEKGHPEGWPSRAGIAARRRANACAPSP